MDKAHKTRALKKELDNVGLASGSGLVLPWFSSHKDLGIPHIGDTTLLSVILLFYSIISPI